MPRTGTARAFCVAADLFPKDGGSTNIRMVEQIILLFPTVGVVLSVSGEVMFPETKTLKIWFP